MFQEEKKPVRAQEEYEVEQNLIGFFALLLEIDRRNNPGKYKKKDA